MTLKELAKNYWDVGAMMLGAAAFGDYNSEIFGPVREYLMVGAPLISLAGSLREANRFARNIFAGIGALCFFSTNGGILNVVGIGETEMLKIKIGSYVMAAFFTGAAAFEEFIGGRRRGASELETMTEN